MSKDASHLIVGRALAVSLLVTGLTSAAVTLIPAHFGNVDWEFGTLGELAAVEALPVMGLAAVLMVGLIDHRRWAVGSAGIGMILFGLAGIGAAGILVTDTPIVLSAAGNTAPAQASSIKVVLVKSLLLWLVFSIGLIGTGIGALRSVQRGR